MKTITGMNQRELGRKERSIEETNKQIKRYKSECSEVVTRKLNKDEIEKINNGEMSLFDLPPNKL